MKRGVIILTAAFALASCGGENKPQQPRSIGQGIDAACERWSPDRTVSRCRGEARDVYVDCRADQSSYGQLDPDPLAIAECEGQARAWTP